ncbi:MAG TPA: hypothetical protein VLS93_01680 [Anaeromyxobacteraceae bacterium]|nr:hypothetical protein [Anaeromyxobacteraceae bacterium]
MRGIALRGALLALVATAALPACEHPAGRPPEEIAATSPFGVYSPWGEMVSDHVTFVTPQRVAQWIEELGVKWVQELPFAADVARPSTCLYSRVGREAGMGPGQVPGDAYRAALRDRIRAEGGRVKWFEVDTEPDGIGGWFDDPAGYAALLEVTREVVKAECPDCRTVFGGLSGWMRDLETRQAEFLDAVLAAGGTFDAIELKLHHVSAKQYVLLETKLDATCAVLEKHAIDCLAIPIFVETAMYDGDPRDPQAKPLLADLPVQSEAEQAAGLVKTYVHGVAIGIDKIFWNLVVERTDWSSKPDGTTFGQNPFNHYGLYQNPMNGDGLSGPKLAWYAYRKMVEVLEGSDWKAVETVQAEPGGVHLYRLTREGRAIWVGWSDGAAAAVSIPVGGASRARATQSVPAYPSGSQVPAYDTAFDEWTLDASAGNVTLVVGNEPVFLRSD